MSARAWAAGIVLLYGALLLLMPVLPGQDLPQHLAYAAVIADGGRTEALATWLADPRPISPYSLTHHLLAALMGPLGAEGALRLLLIGWMFAWMAALDRLVRVVWRGTAGLDGGGPWTPLLGAGLLWGPVAAMGFLPFQLAMPPALFGLAAALDHAEGGARRVWVWAVGWAALATSLHLAAGGLLVGLVAVHACAHPSARRWASAGAVGLGAVGAAVAWSWAGAAGVTTRSPDLVEAWRQARGLEFWALAFGMEWRDPLSKLSQVLWTTLGPYRWDGLVLVGGAALGLAWVVSREVRTRRPAEVEPRVRGMGRTALLWVGAGILCPWGIEIPSIISYIDLRFWSLIAAAGVAVVPPTWFTGPRARRALLAFVVAQGLHFGARAHSFAQEAAPALSLLHDAAGPDLSAALTFHPTSDHFAAVARLEHFLPVYALSHEASLNTRFWGCNNPQMPVCWEGDKPPRRPPEWEPWLFDPHQLGDARWILVRAPEPDDPAQLRQGWDRVAPALARVTAKLRCDGGWCLYRLSSRPKSAPTPRRTFRVAPAAEP